MSSRFRLFSIGLLAAVLAVLAAPSFAYDWQKFAPKNAGFSVDVPCKPEFSSRHLKNAVGYAWLCTDEKNQFIVMAGTSDFYGPAVDTNEMFSQFEAGFLDSVKGKETSNKRASFRGADGKKLPASIFTFTAGDRLGVFEMVMDGNTMYVIDVGWRKGFNVAKVRKRVMTSFKLLPRTRPPEPQEPDVANEEKKSQ